MAHQVVQRIAQARVAQDPGVDVAGHGHLRAQQRVPQVHQHLLRPDPGPARSEERFHCCRPSAAERTALFLPSG